MKKTSIFYITGLLLLISIVSPGSALAAEPSMATYTCYPVFQVNTVAPSIMVILDNSGSMNFQAYTGDYDHSTEYYGYFEPYKKYSYASNLFTRNASGDWDGNFLNWLTMRRIDVARKALMGGLATSRTGGGNQVNIGETPAQSGRGFLKSYRDTNGVTPLSSSSSYNYLVDGGYFYVDGGTYAIKVQKDITYADEADNFVDGNIAGVFQKLGSKARWGNAFFEYGTGSNESGATIDHVIGTNMTTLITDFQNTGCASWAPLAEAYYIAMQYFKQDDEDITLDYANGAADNANLGDDPYYNGSEYVDCAKSFVLLVTDGSSTKDAMIPAMYKDYADAFDTFLADPDGGTACDEDTGTGCEYPSGGTDYLKDVAYWARVNDLRSSSVGKSALDGDQNLILYAVYAFGNDADAENLIKEAAKNGGYVEKDGTTGPSSQSEWDADSDGEPDTYFRSDTGSNLESKILQAINAILERAASGTAVSVLATSSEGEGNLVQAYFRPVKTVGTTDINWLGYLQSLWVDSYGNMREDTNSNQTLEIATDKIITHFLDSSTGDTKVKRFSVSSSVPYPDTETASYEILELDEVNAIWEAGSILADRSASARTIFTYLDKDEDGVVDETTDNPFDGLGEVVKFHTDAASEIKPYLGVRDNTEWSYLGAAYDDRVTNLIQYVRGETVSGLRRRAADYDGDSSDEEWKLADIVHSTPVTVSKPPDNFHLIYSDESYQTYYNAFKNRETVVYVGANDGMLHAFTSWKYNSTTKQFSKPSGTTEGIGDELWGYIPQSLLPHLKWLPSTSYTHVYYADLKPKVFDAKILPDETHYTDTDGDDNWGTFVLLGLNLGGGNINVLSDFNNDGDTSDTTDDRDFAPSYALLDVTDPRNPRLLWERSYGDLELTSSIPAIAKVKDKWFAIFGSGPSACECDESTTTKSGHVFVVDLKTGNPYQNSGNDWLFQTGESKAFMNSPVALDKNLNYNVDAIYIGEAYYASASWKGKMYRVTIPWADGTGAYDGSDTNNYSDNPLDGTKPWTLSAFFNATRPITAPAGLSVDKNDNAWVYVGTGRYLNTADKTNTDSQYIFGIKDPFFNQNRSPSTYYHSYSSTVELTISDLLTTDGYTVTTANEVYDGSDTLVANLEALVAAEDGWIRTLSTSKERILVKPAMLGGVVFVPSFVPSSDICGYGGDSYLYGLYYLTGTAYWDPIFRDETTTISIGGIDKVKVFDKIFLGAGKASSLGLHVGLGDDATGFIQQSTGTVLQKKLNPAFNVKSGLTSWIQK